MFTLAKFLTINSDLLCPLLLKAFGGRPKCTLPEVPLIALLTTVMGLLKSLGYLHRLTDPLGAIRLLYGIPIP